MSKEVITVGGGNGSHPINEALLRTGKVGWINAIGAVYDTGGNTGRRKLDSYGQEIAHGDTVRILPSLVPPEDKDTPAFKEMKKILSKRDERDRALGQEYLQQFFDPENGLSAIEQQMRAFGINLRGRVLPSSTEPSNIVFTTQSGRKFKGEHNFDDLRMSKDMVVDMHLDPEVEGYAPAVDAIKSSESEAIVFSCGGLYPSVLANSLPIDMKDAFSKSKAKNYLVTNLVSTRNETHEFTPRDFVDVVKKYTGRTLDGLIVPEMSRKKFESDYPETAYLYDLEHAHFLGWEEEEFSDVKKDGIEVVTHNATSIVGDVVRHDPQRLSSALSEILSE
jgi:uncharacterized cofD-like protein